MDDPRTQQVIQEFQRVLLEQDRRLARVERGNRRPQLAHSSLEEGQSLEVRGPSGETRTRIGWLPDGTVGMVTEGGDPVSAPTAPTVTPSLGGLRVTWDGQLAGDLAIPGDFDHMAVHISTSSGFTPSAATYVGAIRRAGDGGMLPVIPLPYEPHYVVLVPVTTGGIHGDPSAEVAATPLQVTGPDLTAGSVQAAHIAAGAVTADKLEAILVLASTIVGGIPGGARVELDSGGLRGYDAEGALIFAIDSSGNAVFSGDITGSTITGSIVEIGENVAGSNYGVLQEQADGSVTLTVRHVGGPRAQLMAADGFAELSVWGSDLTTSPAAGMAATPITTQFVFFSDFSQTYDAPHSVVYAEAGGAGNQWVSPTGSRTRIVADADYSALFSAPPSSDTEPPADVDGSLYAYRFSTGTPAMSMQSPVVATGPGAGMRAMLHLAGTTSTRDYARAEVHARRVVVGAEWDQINEVFTDHPGVLFIDPTHSIASDRHAPVTTAMQAQPTATGTGDWVDFTEAEFPSIDFVAPWSGRVEISINMCGFNHGTTNATLSTGFRLSGTSTLAPDLSRAAMVRCVMSDVSERGAAGRMASVTLPPLQLSGNQPYTLTPCWRTSSSYDWNRTDAAGGDLSQGYDLGYQNSIIVKPLM